jgi:hypothetical protein
MKRFVLIYLWILFGIAAVAWAQESISPFLSAQGKAAPNTVSASAKIGAPDVFSTPPAMPRMAPDFALQVLQGHAKLQAADLAGYSATTVVRAELPETSQSGEYEVKQHYSAPRTLIFKALRFTGDNFVKTNVILRVLQSEVDHVQKDDPALTAINPTNYKFSYKGTAEVNDRLVHVFQIKPHQKRAGLFKGKIYVDAYSGTLARAEGKMVRSPSLFVKKIEFVQDFADFKSFTFPVHIHSEAQARIVGRTVVDIYEHDLEPVSAVSTQTRNSVGGS